MCILPPFVWLAPEFDTDYEYQKVRDLWRAGDADDRIEPIPCGEREWETNDSRYILEVARREGIEISI